MRDKLLVEIDLFNGEINDALPALAFLSNELYEAGVFEVSSAPRWNEKVGHAYELKWRFSEAESSNFQVSLDLGLVYSLIDTLSELNGNIPESKEKAIGAIKSKLEAHANAALSVDDWLAA